jgi:hypothetical protein
MLLVDPWPWQPLMQLAFVITIPTLLLAVCLTAAFEREICILMLNWLQEFESKRARLPASKIRRLLERPRAIKPRRGDSQRG